MRRHAQVQQEAVHKGTAARGRALRSERLFQRAEIRSHQCAMPRRDVRREALRRHAQCIWISVDTNDVTALGRNYIAESFRMTTAAERPIDVGA